MCTILFRLKMYTCTLKGSSHLNIKRKMIQWSGCDVFIDWCRFKAAMTIQVKSGGPPLTPVLDAYGVRTVNASVNFYPSCGSDKICVPDLKLMTTMWVFKSIFLVLMVFFDLEWALLARLLFPSRFIWVYWCSEGGDTAKIIQGSTQSVMLDVEVVNDGEDAVQAAFFMKLPEPVEFVRYESNKWVEAEIHSPYTTYFKSIKCARIKLGGKHLLWSYYYLEGIT